MYSDDENESQGNGKGGQVSQYSNEVNPPTSTSLLHSSSDTEDDVWEEFNRVFGQHPLFLSSQLSSSSSQPSPSSQPSQELDLLNPLVSTTGPATCNNSAVNCSDVGGFSSLSLSSPSHQSSQREDQAGSSSLPESHLVPSATQIESINPNVDCNNYGDHEFLAPLTPSSYSSQYPSHRQADLLTSSYPSDGRVQLSRPVSHISHDSEPENSGTTYHDLQPRCSSKQSKASFSSYQSSQRADWVNSSLQPSTTCNNSIVDPGYNEIYLTPPPSYQNQQQSNEVATRSSQTCDPQYEQFLGSQLIQPPSNPVENLDEIFEGVFSQGWCSRPPDDPSWYELAKLREELVNKGLLNSNPNGSRRLERDLAQEGRERGKLIRYIRHCIHKFGKTNTYPIGILRRRDWANANFNEVRGVHLDNRVRSRTFMKPARQSKMLTLLCRIFFLLRQNTFATKRDLYYQDKSVYKNQRVCDELIEDLCCMLQQTRKSLNIISCPKGLIYGHVIFTIGGVEYNCMQHKRGLTISQDVELIDDIKSDAKFILVVEKDASFQNLISSNISDKFPLIMLTGKGFPDLDTRRLLKILVDTLALPVLGLFDANPYGIEILCIYRYGSLAMAYNAHNCVVPQLRWLGFHPTDIDKWRIPEHLTDELTPDDKRKILGLELRPYIIQNKSWAEQVAFLKKCGVKAELQACENLIEAYLPQKIQTGSWI